MGQFEKLAFNTTSEEKKLLDLILLWKRFIDDVLLLFSGTEAECGKLVTWLNSLLPGVIKLKCYFQNSRTTQVLREFSVKGKFALCNGFCS